MKALGALAALLLGLAVWPAAAASLDYVGGYDPATPGYNATAVGLDGTAFLGSWGSRGSCPSLGVRVYDIHDPTAPVPLGTVAAYPGTTAEHVAAARLQTSAFDGAVLFAGVQRCDANSGATSGLAVWDVTDPANPSELAVLSTGREGRGVHEFTVRQRGERWYAYLAVPSSELAGRRGDLRIVDVTDPRRPIEVADWGARRDAGLSVGTGRSCQPACRGLTEQAFLHSVSLSADGRTAYLSYWDQGVILLDVSEPATPVWLGHFTEPLATEGNAHSVSATLDGRLALVTDETETAPWGVLRLVDVQDPTRPVQAGEFQTANGAAGARGEQYAYSVHNALADDRDPSRAYLAWYADGVRLLDVSDASAPVEVGAWVPAQRPLVWNVAFMGDVLIAGDVNNGLLILQR